MTLFDHLFVFVLLVMTPAAGFLSFRRLRKKAATGETISRTAIYNSTMFSQWLLFAIALLGWTYHSRNLTTLGFGFSLDRNSLIGISMTLIAVAILIRQIVRARKASDKALLELRRSVDLFDLLMPRNGNELARFYAVSMTAGVVEETLWRGFLFWYLQHYMPLWTAALVSTLVFTIGHVYQGPRQLPTIAMIGGVFAGLYLLTGSLWLPILLHAAVDILQGRMAYEIMQRTEAAHAGSSESTP